MIWWAILLQITTSSTADLTASLSDSKPCSYTIRRQTILRNLQQAQAHKLSKPSQPGFLKAWQKNSKEIAQRITEPLPKQRNRTLLIVSTVRECPMVDNQVKVMLGYPWMKLLNKWTRFPLLVKRAVGMSILLMLWVVIDLFNSLRTNTLPVIRWK